MRSKLVFLIQQAALVGLAGFLGAILRFAVASTVDLVTPRGFPFGTLAVNVSGCFFLAVFLTVVRDRAVSDVLRLTIAVGFVGAYTTYSTFAFEIYELFKTGHAARGLTYLTVSLILGLAAVWIGIEAAHRLEAS